MKTTTTALMVALVAGCSDAGSSSPQCGEGTIEEDGVCVAGSEDEGGSSADDDDAGVSATTAATSVGDEDDDDEIDSAEGDSGGDATPTYASCFAGSDVECTHNEKCIESLDTCAATCTFDTDCPHPPGGTAVQRCESLAGHWSEICVLYCGVEGAACPVGMVCRETTLCDGNDGGSSTGGGWGTTGCDASSLEICVWE